MKRIPQQICKNFLTTYRQGVVFWVCAFKLRNQLTLPKILQERTRVSNSFDSDQVCRSSRQRVIKIQLEYHIRNSRLCNAKAQILQMLSVDVTSMQRGLCSKHLLEKVLFVS